MDQILLCSNQIPRMTTITNAFIQKYMLHANGSYVKVYLYLSMCIQSGEPGLSISSLADMMENTEKDVLRALTYWEKNGLMELTRNDAGNICGINMLHPAAEPPTAKASATMSTDGPQKTPPDAKNRLAPPASKMKETKAAPESTGHTVTVTADQTVRMAKDSGFKWICCIVENYLGRPVKPAEIELLTYLYDTLRFSKELILHLYEYCCSLHKTNVKYVQAVALSWAEENVSTPEEAQALTFAYSNTHSAIAKALGLTRPLAAIELEYVKRWEKEWHMDLAVIIEACNRTMLAIQKADFKYIDGILGNWHQKDVHTLQDVQGCDEEFRVRREQPTRPKASGRSKNAAPTRPNQFQSFQQRDSSPGEMDELEKLLLTR